MSNNCVGEQKSDYVLRKIKLKAIFALSHRCSTYLKSTSEFLYIIYVRKKVLWLLTLISGILLVFHR